MKRWISSIGRLKGLQVTLLSAFLFSTHGCKNDEPAEEIVSPTASLVKEMKPAVMAFCADCHAYPPPDSFPKDSWVKEVEQGFGFYTSSGRTDLAVPDLRKVIRYYESQAPEEIALPVPGPVSTTSPVSFEQQIISNPEGIHSAGVADLLFAKNSLYASDMKNGLIAKVDLNNPSNTPVIIASDEKHPCHLEFCDVDDDGSDDLLFSDLGSFLPDDHANGRVVLKGKHGAPNITLGKNIGRVSDVKLADINGDGLNDLVVAEFGWRQTGNLLLLERTEAKGKPLTAECYKRRVLDERHGASHVSVQDLDGDDDLDLVVLFSQEHECIVAFINDGTGTFTKKTVFSANQPDYGSSCIEVVDVDNDNDLDVVFCNGDSMDSHMLKACHSVQWLENDGDLNFTHHHVDNLMGVYGVTCSDFDGDGDLDFAAVTMTWWYSTPFNSVVWFEQQPDGGFVRHNLDLSTGQHATLEVGDFDGDGDPDIAVGEFDSRDVATPGLCSIWWNKGNSH